MAGAYTARAPADPADPGYPPGWLLTWQFPGPWPPGYTPVLSYTLVTGETYVPGATHDATATLFDQVTYETDEPDNPMIWTATIDGVSVELKLDGDADWVEVLETNHSVIGSYGVAPTLRFNVSEDNEGDIIILKGVSTPFNDVAVSDEVEAEIEVVVEHTWTAKLDFTCSFAGGGGANYLHQPSFRADDGESETQRAYAQIGYHWFIGPMWGSDVDGDLTVSQLSTYVGRIEIDEFDGSVYALRVDDQASPGDADVSYTLTLYRDDEVYAVYTKEKTFTEPWDPPGDVGTVWLWLTIDTENEEIIEYDEILDTPASLGVWP